MMNDVFDMIEIGGGMKRKLWGYGSKIKINPWLKDPILESEEENFQKRNCLMKNIISLIK